MGSRTRGELSQKPTLHPGPAAVQSRQDVLETLVKASYARDKTALLVNANEGIEMTRWIIRMAHDRKLLAPKQFEFSALQLNECFLGSVPAL